MNTTEALLTITQVLKPKAFMPEADLVPLLIESFHNINNDDSNQYNSFAYMFDITFASESKTYILVNTDTQEMIDLTTTCQLAPEFVSPSIDLGIDDHTIFNLVKLFYEYHLIDEIYEEHQSVINRYLEEVRDDHFKLMCIDTDIDESPHSVKQFKDAFGVITHECGVSIYELFNAIMSCVDSFREYY